MSAVRYVTQEDWDAVQGALAAVLRVTNYMPEAHHREAIRNIIKPVHVSQRSVNLQQELTAVLGTVPIPGDPR